MFIACLLYFTPRLIVAIQMNLQLTIHGRHNRIDSLYPNIITVFMFGFQNAHYDYDFEIIYVCISPSRTLLKVAKRLQTFLVILLFCYE